VYNVTPLFLFDAMGYTILTMMIKQKQQLFYYLYKYIAKPVFFRIDPEVTHDIVLHVGRFLGKFLVLQKITTAFFGYKNTKLRQNLFGVIFPNPVGLAAGFDKNAQLMSILPAVGFGFEEVGSVTAKPCVGNPKPRLWRLKKSQSLLVYYGLKNDGSLVIEDRLKRTPFRFPVGLSIAKTNSKDTVVVENGVADYLASYRRLASYSDYVAINISCPNSFGGLAFTKPDFLDALLVEVEKESIKKPVFLKLSPDLTEEVIDGILAVCEKYTIAGFICGNLTKVRNNQKIKDAVPSQNGGLSGKVVSDLSNTCIRYIYKKTKGRYVIIGCGGITSGADAYEKIKSGASLVQLITGMIFEGPQVIGQINRELVELLQKDGYANISEAIGVSVKYD